MASLVAARAIIRSRAEGKKIHEGLVSSLGRFDRLGPVGMKVLSKGVNGIARKACDHRLSLAERVEWVQKVLEETHNPAELVKLLEEREVELEAARKASELTLHASERIAAVVSTHRFATNLGYENAQVVIAMNPAMPVDPKDPVKGTYRKFTVCRYDSHTPCDLPSALKEFQALEVGWGGRGDIFGSPQGVSSTLTLEQVLEVVARPLN